MKTLTPFLFSAALFHASLASADVVIAEEADTLLGKTTGAWAGILVGGAAGGPLGALALGAIGAWSGGEVQETAGLNGTAYRVRREDGSETVVRSPNHQWAKGDRVEIAGNRLIASPQYVSGN